MCLCEGLCYEMEQLQSIPFADYSNSNGPLTRISSNPAFSRALASFWGVNTGCLGMSFNGNCVLQNIVICWHFFPQIYQSFNIAFYRLFGHGNGFLESLTKGNTSSQSRHYHSIAAFLFFFEPDSVIQSLH
jgi:hypothetical protein